MDHAKSGLSGQSNNSVWLSSKSNLNSTIQNEIPTSNSSLSYFFLIYCDFSDFPEKIQKIVKMSIHIKTIFSSTFSILQSKSLKIISSILTFFSHLYLSPLLI